LTADPLFLVLIAVVSLLLSYIGATVGLVLGQLRVALLVYALGSATVGAATSLAISTAGTLIGTLRHAVDGRVQLKLLLSVGAALGRGRVLQRPLRAARRPAPAQAGDRARPDPHRRLAMLLPRRPRGRARGAAEDPADARRGRRRHRRSAPSPAWSACCSARLRLPAMIRYARIATPTAIGTNMAIGTLTGLSAGVATFLEGQIDLIAFAVVAPTTVLGAHFGARRTGLLAPETLIRVIAWVLAATGLLMLVRGPDQAVARAMSSVVPRHPTSRSPVPRDSQPDPSRSRGPFRSTT
jgi:uncharacterized membrane protein YfcA